MMPMIHVRGSRRWGVSALLLVALAAGAALLTIRPAAAYTARPDLQVSLTSVTQWANADGWFYSYKVTVRNPHEYDPELRREFGAAALGVVAQYTAPEYTAVQSVTATGGFTCSFAGRMATCTVGYLANDGSATFTVVSKLVSGPAPNAPVAAWDAFCNPRHAAVVDPADRILERDETNNTAAATQSLAGPCIN